MVSFSPKLAKHAIMNYWQTWAHSPFLTVSMLTCVSVSLCMCACVRCCVSLGMHFAHLYVCVCVSPLLGAWVKWALWDGAIQIQLNWIKLNWVVCGSYKRPHVWEPARAGDDRGWDGGLVPPGHGEGCGRPHGPLPRRDLHRPGTLLFFTSSDLVPRIGKQAHIRENRVFHFVSLCICFVQTCC